ncbi:PH domain-containing protein [Croceicoccus sp. Ery5]|uniref:PH domain-containing protein n=1 Tax=Croceicoccus sp. Ery5 TaxID=1703340 RepID=UPI001E60D80C|nr:PH domain-containing protein [Croceicoccus sp. Ery5]
MKTDTDQDNMTQPLTPLHPSHRTALMIEGAIVAIPLLIAGVVIEIAAPLPMGVAILPAALVALWCLGWAPMRRYRHKGFAMGEDRLRVVKGWLFHRDTVVPFGRVQHIDVNRGPVERMLGLSTLVLHTAGTHNSSVTLPGLLDEDAQVMREAIRSHITRETEGV